MDEETKEKLELSDEDYVRFKTLQRFHVVKVELTDIEHEIDRLVELEGAMIEVAKNEERLTSEARMMYMLSITAHRMHIGIVELRKSYLETQLFTIEQEMLIHAKEFARITKIIRPYIEAAAAEVEASEKHENTNIFTFDPKNVPSA